MIKINVLLENNSINPQYKSKHGLSLFIEHCKKNILLDVGPDNNFIKNAEINNVDLSRTDYLFLSHNHNDHTGGLNDFMKINKTAKIYLMDNIFNKYYLKVLFVKLSIGLKFKKKNRSGIIQLKDDLNIENRIFFLGNSVSKYQKPLINNRLYKKHNGKIINDTFDHEGILVLDDGNEQVIFNSCSHNGILNCIDTVKAKIPNKKIRSYVGGLHIFDQIAKTREGSEYLDTIIDELKKTDIIVYTGHCTGKLALDYLKNKLGNRVHEINTGMELNV